MRKVLSLVLVMLLAFSMMAVGVSAAETGDPLPEAVNGVVTLTQNLTAPTGGYVITTDTTINLNGYNISASTTDTVGDGVFHVTGGTLTINGTGVINGVGGSKYTMAVWADGGNVIINGGTYTNEGSGDDDQYDLIYAKNGGSVVINGGTFKSETPKWTLNAHDETSSTIAVKGGTFKDYNPGEVYTEPTQPINFVAEGYAAVKNSDGTYTVECDHDYYKYEEHAAVEETCTTSGNYAYKICGNCGTIFMTKEDSTVVVIEDVEEAVIPASHNAIAVNPTDPTCVEEGNILHGWCLDCENIILEDGTIGTEEDVTVPATGKHTLMLAEAKAPTCTEEGNIECYVCEGCDQIFADKEATKTLTQEEVLIPAAHKYAEVKGTAATCTEDGMNTYYKCSECGLMYFLDGNNPTIFTDVKDMVLEATGHTPAQVKANVVSATTEAEGYTGDVVCEDCDTVLEKGEVIAKLAPTVVAPIVEEKVQESVNEEVTTIVETVLDDTKDTTAVSEETKAAIKEVVEADPAAVIGADLVATPVEEKEVPAEEVKAIEKAAAAESSTTKIAQYVDIKVLVVNRSDNNKVLGNITELEKPVEVAFDIPKAIQSDKHTYFILHYHDNVVERIDGKMVDGKLVIDADKFSTYALAYEEKTVDDNHATGDDFNVNMWAIMFAVSGAVMLGAMAMVMLKKRTN